MFLFLCNYDFNKSRISSVDLTRSCKRLIKMNDATIGHTNQLHL